MPQAQFGPIPVPDGVPDERFLYLSDILPTAWQGVEYAGVPEGGSLAVFGLGPVGLLAVAIGVHRGLRVIGVDNVPERMAKAEAYGATVVRLRRRPGRRDPPGSPPAAASTAPSTRSGWRLTAAPSPRPPSRVSASSPTPSPSP